MAAALILTPTASPPRTAASPQPKARAPLFPARGNHSAVHGRVYVCAACCRAYSGYGTKPTNTLF